jgi:hypothetical protein
MRPFVSLLGSPRLATARFVVTSFLLWRGALFAVDLLAVHAIPERHPNPNKDYWAFPQSKFWDSFARWDSGWYNRIALRGYYFEGRQSNVAFFPAYPYLSRWLGKVVGGHWVAGLILSNLALLGALFFVHGISRRYLDEDGARRAVVYVLVFPSSIFLSAFYAEGLFLFAAAGAFYFYERDRLLLAGIFGCLAALTRFAGVLLFPALLLGALHRTGWSWRPLTPRLLFLLLIPAGLGIFMLILAVQVGDPMAWAKAQAGWGRETAFPLLTIFRDARSLDWSFAAMNSDLVGRVLDLVATLGLFAAVAASLRRLDLAHATFAFLSVAMPLFSGRTLSMLRFASGVVPIYLLLAMAGRRPAWDRLITAAMALILALETVLFARWYWAG